MTSLLVSVRSAVEVPAALDGGAHLIDIKEPRRGALGAADPQVWKAVLAEVGQRRPVSAALGELLEAQVASRAGQTTGLQFAKVGLAGCGGTVDWPRRWARVLACLPEAVTPVAVVYADWGVAQAPPPADVVEHAARLGSGAVLIDTFDKTGGGLFEHLNERALASLIEHIRAYRLPVVLGGSLDQDSIATALQFRPEYVAVRRAVCDASREGTLDGRRVQQLAGFLADSSRRKAFPQ